MLASPVLEWAPRLTLIFLMAVRPWRQHGPPATFAYFIGRIYLILLMAGLLIASLAAAPAYWFAVVGVHGLWLVSGHAVADNHRYLEGYWCLAIAVCLAMGGADGSRYLALDARLLIGLCFLLAVLWKLNPRFRNGSFIVQTFLYDYRFVPIAFSTGVLTPEIRNRHVEARIRIESGRSVTEQAPIPRALRNAALAMTWWTIFIEAGIAILFLLPFPQLALWRTIALLVFVATTYVLVPVPAFGHILLILLMVSTPDARWRMPMLALAAFLIVTDFTPIVPTRVSRWWKNVMRRRMHAAPQFRWTHAVTPHRFERDGDAWQMVFPSVDLSVQIKPEWVGALERLLKLDRPFSWNDLGQLAPEIPRSELPGLITTLIRQKVLSDVLPG